MVVVITILGVVTSTVRYSHYGIWILPIVIHPHTPFKDNVTSNAENQCRKIKLHRTKSWCIMVEALLYNKVTINARYSIESAIIKFVIKTTCDIILMADLFYFLYQSMLMTLSVSTF